MTEEELLQIIVSDRHPEINRTLSELTRMLTKSIASIGHKLEDDELSEFLCIAVGLHQKGLQESKSGLDTETVLNDLHVKLQP